MRGKETALGGVFFRLRVVSRDVAQREHSLDCAPVRAFDVGVVMILLRLLLSRTADRLADRVDFDLAIVRGGVGLHFLHSVRDTVERRARGTRGSEKRIAISHCEFLSGFGRSRVHDQGAGAAERLGLCADVLQFEIAAVEIELLRPGPGHVHYAEPFFGIVVALVMLALLHAEHLELAFVPAGDDVEAEASGADLVGGDHLLGCDDRVEQRRVDRAKHRDTFCCCKQACRPRNRLERGAVEIALAAVALPASDREHEVDAGIVCHLAELQAIGPARGPTFRDECCRSG